MKLRFLIIAISGILILALVLMFIPFIGELGSNSVENSLLIEPDDGMSPVIQIIRNAKISIDLVIYELADDEIEKALVNTEKRGIAVRVILSQGYEGQISTVNAPAYAFLRANGVPVRWAPIYFTFTHQKTLIIDNDEALIMSFNLVAKYYPTSRDFGFMDRDPNDVRAIENVFDNDWQDVEVTPDQNTNLVWSPGSETTLINLINSAKTSLEIYNEEMADVGIERALENAAGRGVDVRVAMTYSYDWRDAFKELSAAGVEIRTYDLKAPLYIHAKMILADNARAFIGSENFSPTSLDDNRELGIMIPDASTIKKLSDIFNADWQDATPF